MGEQGIPFAWRGGVMTPVPKKPTAALSLSNARGVLCAEVCAKVVARTVRQVAVPVLEAVAGDSQLGALPGRGTDIASSAVRSFLDLSAAAGV